ncbi:TPA: hypothetical protein RQJ75_003496 [Vibrio vulnificus]|nr:hypothetical protein [Vibrio vulnificus]HAS6375255.1 hypothetical protein [Vibrio vulnificus]HDY7652552.1 hypothetical protein [Vibrio vulnificus]HDY7712974.1 hypothetical protein [Vibrio vulnificus]
MSDNVICYWKKLSKNIKSVPGKSIENPKFVFAFLIIMAISSAGIWVPWAFNLELSSVCNIKPDSLVLKDDFFSEKYTAEIGSYQATLYEKTNSISHDANKLKESIDYACKYVGGLPVTLFQGFAVFMFNLGILGGIAFDFFVTQGPKRQERNNLTEEKMNEERVNEFAGFFTWIVAFVLSFYGLTSPTNFDCLTFLGALISVSLWVCVNYNKAEFKQPKPTPGNITAEGIDSNENLSGEGLK